MPDARAIDAFQRLQRFFEGAAALPPAQVRALCSVDRASTTSHLAFGVHPDRLTAVSSGRWTRRHDDLAKLAHDRARHCAARLAPFGRRRLLSVVLEDAALVVISDACAEPVLSPGLRDRLAAPWQVALGGWPGDDAAARGVSAEQGVSRPLRASAR